MLNSLLLGSLSSSGREATAPHTPAPAGKHNLIIDPNLVGLAPMTRPGMSGLLTMATDQQHI